MDRSTGRTVQLDRGDVGLRVDLVLLRHLRHIPGVTRNRLQRLIDHGSVHINGHQAMRASSRVAASDMLRIQLPERQPRVSPAAEALPLDVLYEDRDLLVVNKPAGQVSHPAFRHTSGTLLNALLGHAAGQWVPALLSRLDKDTSGLVLVAKGPAVQTALQRVGDRNGIEKDYLAIVHGKPSARGTIDLALDRDPWDRRRVTVRDRGGARSVTKFQRLRSIAFSDGTHLSLVRCRLVTGRTHQIRVHLSARGWPIVGDAVYKAAGGSDMVTVRSAWCRVRSASAKCGVRSANTECVSDGSLGAAAAFPRQALHAWRLVFPHPSTGATVDVTAPIPADMQGLLASLASLASEGLKGTKN